MFLRDDNSNASMENALSWFEEISNLNIVMEVILWPTTEASDIHVTQGNQPDPDIGHPRCFPPRVWGCETITRMGEPPPPRAVNPILSCQVMIQQISHQINPLPHSGDDPGLTWLLRLTRLDRRPG